MELQEIRNLIKKCLDIKIRETSGKKSDINNFSQFREAFAFSLARACVSRVFVDEILWNENSLLFESVYNAWKNIALEMLLVPADERKIAWNEISPYYIRTAVLESLSGSPYKNSLQEISNNVVSRMML